MDGEAEAFAPGHITGFFEICDEPNDPSRIGSRGAGFSVDKGVRSRVRITTDDLPSIDVRIDGQPEPAPTTRRAVELLAAPAGVHAEVDQTMELPVGQGFGMSAAGALSAAMATAEVLGRTTAEAVWAAHTAEVLNRTGLGDVVGAAQGGFEVRLEPGLPPYGRVESWTPKPPPAQVLLAIVAPELSTRRVLSDAAQRAQIQRAGAEAVRSFAAARSLEHFVALARRFSLGTRLADPRILAAYDRLGPSTLASQSMLGGSLFVFSGSPTVRKTLEGLGRVIEAGIDTQGARLTVPRRPLAASRGR